MWGSRACPPRVGPSMHAPLSCRSIRVLDGADPPQAAATAALSRTFEPRHKDCVLPRAAAEASLASRSRDRRADGTG
eukprot:364950-Chlamydomonas_euryale.AAC.4